MKCQIIVDKEAEERAVIYTHSVNERIEAIKRFIEGESAELVGYSGKNILPIDPKEVSAFITESGSVYAIVGGERLLIKERLYSLEASLGSDYIRINQSCLANRRQIERFEATISASLAVIFRDGYRDFVSRRQMKYVKERMGIL